MEVDENLINWDLDEWEEALIDGEPAGWEIPLTKLPPIWVINMVYNKWYSRPGIRRPHFKKP